jgi:hypothetical protein
VQAVVDRGYRKFRIKKRFKKYVQKALLKRLKSTQVINAAAVDVRCPHVFLP